MMDIDTDKNRLYRSIPKVDIILEQELIKDLIKKYGRNIVIDAVRSQTENLRKLIQVCDDEKVIREKIDNLTQSIEIYLKDIVSQSMRSVINATGMILHTNLGRAPISSDHADRLKEIITGYSNLEYDLETGERGERYFHFEKLICKITGAEAAIAVNNNAAAVMLVLNAMAKSGEIIVSRGELVEIGGKFRIPDVMEQSGALLVEVGTTNKTHCDDYEAAITAQTRAFLKVHTSNYKIVGFAKSVSIQELKALSKKTGIPIIEDLGSGMLVDLSKYGLAYEPTVQDSIKNGADVVCFSGDKLLGGPQAGIIVGKKKYIDRMKKSQLTRAFRIDKFTTLALELIFREYLDEEKAMKTIPVLKMIRESFDEVSVRAQSLKSCLEQRQLSARIEIRKCESQIGGGSLPLERIASMAVTIKPFKMTVPQLEKAMRALEIPIIARTINDMIYMDVRTIDSSLFSQIAEMLERILQ